MTNNTQFGHTECAPVVRECDEKRTDLLDAPICGLGEDYEPETVWRIMVLGTGMPKNERRTKDVALAVFQSERDAVIAGKHYIEPQPMQSTVTNAIAAARYEGLKCVQLLDHELALLRTWPV